LRAIGFAGFAAGSLETKSELVEKPLGLANTERYGVFLSKMVRQQQSIPQVLVVSQFSWAATDIFAQFSQVFRGQFGGSAGMIAIQQTGESLSNESIDPILNGSWRVSIQACSITGAGSIQDMEDCMESMEIAAFRCSRYFVLNGSLEYLSIGNTCPSHWEPPYNLYSQYIRYLI
jgi:hypothetical protein